MKITSKRERVYSETVTDKTICDLCKKETTRNWREYDSHHNTIEVEIKLNLGNSYPGDAYGDVIEIDLCPSCFTTRLMSWLGSQNALPPRTYDY